MTNPIELAVSPLREDATRKAETVARAYVERVMADLEAHGWDAAQAAPRPNSFRMGRREYKEAAAKAAAYRRLTDRAPGNVGSPRGPDLVTRSDEKVERFVQECREAAAAEYDAFIAKLVKKIGDCDSATIDGNHVWGHSVLTVTKGEDVERWKTQMILNVSVYGKLFNQFPTRKVKGA